MEGEKMRCPFYRRIGGSDTCIGRFGKTEGIVESDLLIAAAPELLEACEAVEEALSRESAHRISKYHNLWAAYDKVRAAIAKAQGGE